MATVKEAVTLNATPEKVWLFVTELEKLIQWRTDIKKFEVSEKEPLEVGKCFSIEKEVQGGVQRFDCTIAQLEENRRFAFEAEAAGFAKVTAVYEIIPEGDGCKFIINETVDVPNIHPSAEVFMQRGLSETIRGFLANLKSMIGNQ